ncbi:hypothetical protein NB688_000125 [Xanthomonas sacchari]|uniref:Uncharacterized protein n=1 Tax=Xanthomonas sacchari TaxID=56458 RepID=A0ABT3DQR8_9XANT|nr:hypothetical protein [Xanthomonas sacchari]MCW0417959.1 hypothetical protein [Xanthomonas sacchari]
MPRGIAHDAQYQMYQAYDFSGFFDDSRCLMENSSFMSDISAGVTMALSGGGLRGFADASARGAIASARRACTLRRRQAPRKPETGRRAHY